MYIFKNVNQLKKYGYLGQSATVYFLLKIYSLAINIKIQLSSNISSIKLSSCHMLLLYVLVSITTMYYHDMQKSKIVYYICV